MINRTKQQIPTITNTQTPRSVYRDNNSNRAEKSLKFIALTNSLIKIVSIY